MKYVLLLCCGFSLLACQSQELPNYKDPYGLPGELQQRQSPRYPGVERNTDWKTQKTAPASQDHRYSPPPLGEEKAFEPSNDPEVLPINPAVEKLLNKSTELRRNGDYERAISTAERALSIDGQEARVYLELAKTRRAQGKNDWARQLLLKGSGLPMTRGTRFQIKLEQQQL